MVSETVKEWMAKAEGDFTVASREMRARKSPNYDAVCFHCQQCIEKPMKALLIHHGIAPPKTHMLLTLDELLAPVCPGWTWPADDLRFLGRAAVFSRYPGESAGKEEARESLVLARKIRSKLLQLLTPGGSLG
jgi:HEPN domain-containing protein